MKYQIRIEVKLKPGHSDPEGQTTAGLLKELGYAVESVNVAKVYDIALEVRSHKEAEDQGEEMCRRLLANPTKDDYVLAIKTRR
jgi:phosphoribosylformylglycinamidine synthase PurS subunit